MTAWSGFNCSASVASDWELQCKEIPEEAAAESVCYGICGLWSAAMGVHSSKTSKDLLPGGAGPLGQDHRECTSSSESRVCSSGNVFALFSPYYLSFALEERL